MNVQMDAACSVGVTMLNRSVLRKDNKYSIHRANSIEGNLQEMSVPMDMSKRHKLIRSYYMQSAGYGHCLM